LDYISTRGAAPPLAFTDTLLTGLADDGGLYLPRAYPQLSPARIAGFAGAPYATVAEAVMAPFVGDEIAPGALRAMIEASYATFQHRAVAPLTQIDANLFVLELFHGPTLAFKDVAMQLLGRLMEHVLAARGQRATIVAATSGDTGAAAIEAFRGLDRVDVFVLYPNGRVSEVQRRQMTTVDSRNIHVVALDGTFDDAQAIVKALFRHAAFRGEVALSGVNSINWARVMAQIVYYFTSATALGAPHRKVSFAVPTGNFGDILAGWIAKRMGLPIERLVIGTNLNDILVRALETGRYSVAGVAATQSPSMDIQVSSNFERLLFEASGRDAALIARQMAHLGQSQSFSIDPAPLATIRADFDAVRVDEDETTREIARVWRETEVLIDPHGAVGVAAGRAIAKANPATPMIVLGTAHPAKFPDAVARAIGVPPPRPESLAAIFDRRERQTHLPNDVRRVEDFIRANVRHAAGAAS
jgi:threonine synthase